MTDALFQFDYELRQHLRKNLASGQSHATNTETLANFPRTLQGKKADGIEHTAWQLLEHMRMAQADILDFCVNPLYEPPTWPDDYWTAVAEPPSERAWEESCQRFHADLEALQECIADREQNLFERISWGKGQTILREALLAADHNSYHLGQIMMLRKALGAWN